MENRDIVIHVTPPSPPKGPQHPLKDLLGTYEAIGLERHKETSGIFYQFLNIGEETGRFKYVENLTEGTPLRCTFSTNDIQPYNGFYVIDLNGCNKEGEYSLLVTPQITLTHQGPFPINSDLSVSLLVSINSAIIERTTQRMKKINGVTILEALEKERLNEAKRSANK
ncbi:MAG: hypothetical protein KZQ93_19870 [Candidatus Thiodiazotropha sp. (ex Monitilora ramsayi)]|nr:hypothetical protein [Candidatus Thiodiazotropha sp. (ex Monitilora ramsayi)]